MSPRISNQHGCITREVCLIDGCMKSPLLCSVFVCACVAMKCVCVSVCEREREREAGVVAAAVAWGEVLPWFSLEFLCFWKPERGKLNLRSPRVSAPWEFSAHISLPPALMVLGVALFSKLGTAKVFFTFQKKERGREKKLMTAPGKASQAWRDWCYSNINLLHISELRKWKSNVDPVTQGTKDIFQWIWVENTSRKSICLHCFIQKVIMWRKKVWCSDCLMFLSIFNDPPLQINKCF